MYKVYAEIENKENILSGKQYIRVFPGSKKTTKFKTVDAAIKQASKRVRVPARLIITGECDSPSQSTFNWSAAVTVAI